MASQTITGSVIATACEQAADGSKNIIITISLPAGGNPIERAASAAAADGTNEPSLPTLDGQSIDGTIDDVTGVISAIAFTP